MKKHRRRLGQDFARAWKPRGRGATGEHRRAQVLIEEPDVAGAFAYWSALEDMGYEVSWCPGPTGPPSIRCPLVDSGHCELVERADVVVSALPLHRESSRKVIAALRRLHPRTPVIVQAPQRQLEQCAPLFEGHWVSMRMPVTRRTLLDSVKRALAKPVGKTRNDSTSPA